MNNAQLHALIKSAESIYSQHFFNKKNKIHKCIYKYLNIIVYSNLEFCAIQLQLNLIS